MRDDKSNIKFLCLHISAEHGLAMRSRALDEATVFGRRPTVDVRGRLRVSYATSDLRFGLND